MDVNTIATAPRSTNTFDFDDSNHSRPVRLTFEIAEPEALLRFIDAAQPSERLPIPQDIVTIADAIEARLAMGEDGCLG